MDAAVSPRVGEHSEAEAMFGLVSGVPDTVRTVLGVSAVRVGDAVVLSMRNDATGFWSKALGFGRTAPVTGKSIAEICAFYRAEGTPLAVFQIAPSAIPEDWAEICAREGITAGSWWNKLIADVGEVAAWADARDRRPVDRVRVTALDPGDADQWASVMMRGFGMPEEHYREIHGATAGRPGWYPHALWMGDELVGSANMYHAGETVQMAGAAVLPHARNRGGQTELLAARARRARELGCRLLVTETGTEMDGRRNPSLHNMLRVGFQVAYQRQNWVWRPTA
jgi:GNAT superfamily N-acetyltransferase